MYLLGGLSVLTESRAPFMFGLSFSRLQNSLAKHTPPTDFPATGSDSEAENLMISSYAPLKEP